MESVPLSWSQRGALWLRIGIRILLLLLAYSALKIVGLPLLSLLAPFVAALITAAILHPLVLFLHNTLKLPPKCSALFILLLLFGLIGLGIGYLVYMAGLELFSLAQNWNTLLFRFQAFMEQLEQASSHLFTLVPVQFNESIQSMMDSFLSWLGSAVPQILNRLIDSTSQAAKGIPSFGLGVIVYLMAAYMMTADYSNLRSQIAQRTHHKLRHLFSQVRNIALSAFGGYIRAELLLSVGVFFILLIGFFITSQPYGLLLALGLAILDFIPIVGAGTVMVPWAVIALFMQDYPKAIELMLIWGVIALFRRVGEPKFVGDQTGLSPIVSLISIYIGMRLAGVLGMVLGPTVMLTIINLLKLGLFERARQDLETAVWDIMAILRGKLP